MLRAGTLRTRLKGRRRYALLLLVGMGSLALMGAQCQPEPVKPPPPTTQPPGPPSGRNFTATLDGLQAVPPVQTQGSGSGTVTLDATETTLNVSFTFSGLSGNTSDARIQGPAAVGTTGPIVMTLPSFPPGVTSGAYSQSFAFPAGQVSNLKAGLLYVNVSTTFRPAGEIRGQILAVP